MPGYGARFLQETSTDDYMMLLLETTIHHGNNIRQLARDTGIAVGPKLATPTWARSEGGQNV